MMDVIQVVEKLDQLGYIRANRVINSYYSIYCPFHNNGNERKASFGVLIQEEIRGGKLYPQGWCHCFTCSYVNTLPGMIEDILKDRSISQSGADWLRDNIPGFDIVSDFDYLIPPNMSDEILSAWNVSAVAVKSLQDMDKPMYPYVSEAELANYRYTVPYMYERGFTDEIIERYDIGYDGNFKLPKRKEITPTLTFPVRDAEGRTQFIYRRGVSTKLFYMPEGLVKPLYGIWELSQLKDKPRSIIICEAIINSLTCIKWGYHSVALMATGNSFQIDQLRQLGAHEFVFALDPDEAGQRAVRKLKRALSDVAITWTITMPEGKDVNDCSEEEFNMLYANKE